MDRHAAVTGAGGSLGRALVAQLVAEGWSVAGLVRRERDAEALRQLKATPVMGDLRDTSSLARLMSGAQVVFHLAAWMGKPAKGELAHAINVEGTRQVVQAAAAAQVKRVVLASSIAVYGPVRDGVITEERAPWPVGDLYGDSKGQGERVARDEADGLGLELVILRPTMIYGPASPSWTVLPFETIQRGLPIIIGDGNDLLDAVYVDDVANALVLAGRVPEAAGESFNISGAAVTWNDFMGAYAKMAGAKLRRVPAPLAWSGARAAAALTRPLLGRPVVIPEMLGVMTSRATFPHDKARRLLGYVPQVDLAEGMRRTEAWLHQAGLLRRPRVALVTGAASGLGQAVARQLAERGLVVYASDIDIAALAPLEPQVRVLALDVTSAESIERAMARLNEDQAQVDLLINTAGILRPGALEAQAMSEIEQQLAVNTLGPLRLAKALAPGMRRRGFGRIINVSSTNGFLVTPFTGAYSASKFALEAFSDALRLELAPWGLEVGVVQPGAMKTPFAESAKAALRQEIGRSGPDWQGYLAGFLNSSLWGTATATPVEAVAGRIVKYALGRRLKARRYGTLDAIPTRLLAALPDSLKDAYFRRAAGLKPKTKNPR